VKRALGPRWGFYEGFWTWIYTFVDLAVYPVLFVEYASFFFPQLHLYKIPVCLFIIWASAILNILGIVPVGKISIVLGLFVLSPFVILWAVTLFTHHGTTGLSHLSLKGVGFSSIGLGIYTVMWNFFGWDNATTYAGEVDRPVRSYVISSALAFVTVFAMYILTSMAVLHSGIDFKVLSDKGFPSIATATSVRGLGTLLAIGGMASAVGLFSAVLLSVSRVPKVMADDGLMPEKLNTLHSKYQTPYISIIVSALIISLMIFWSFTDLIIMDVTLYGAGLFLEFISLIVLRIKAPDEHRPFKIPMKIGALCVMYILSVSIYVIGLTGALSHSDATFIPAFIAVLALISAEIAWRIIVKVKLKAAAAKVKSKGNI
jgi:amino acid transporter